MTTQYEQETLAELASYGINIAPPARGGWMFRAFFDIVRRLICAELKAEELEKRLGRVENLIEFGHDG